jgi:hypothetical protein
VSPTREKTGVPLPYGQTLFFFFFFRGVRIGSGQSPLDPNRTRSLFNPCGNFSLTSNAGWHPALRIVKPRFLASHYY